MQSQNIYNDHRSSLMGFIKDFAATLDGDFQTQYFDALSDMEELPKGNLIGVSGYSITADEHMIEIIVGFIAATQDDQNLFILDKTVGLLFQRLLPTKKIPVFDATTGTQIGLMTIKNGTSVLPINDNLGRPTKVMGITLVSDVTVDLS